MFFLLSKNDKTQLLNGSLFSTASIASGLYYYFVVCNGHPEVPGVDHGFFSALGAEQRERAQFRLPNQLQSGFRAAAGAEHPLPFFNHVPRLLPMAPGGRSDRIAAHAFPAHS